VGMADCMFEGEEYATSKQIQRREPVAVSKRSDLGEERTSSASDISSNEFSLP
jgi:hypothetical protein